MEFKALSIGDTVFGLTHYNHPVVGMLISFEADGKSRVMSDDLYVLKNVVAVVNIVGLAKEHAKRVRENTPFLE
jgi:hypothetical protein